MADMRLIVAGRARALQGCSPSGPVSGASAFMRCIARHHGVGQRSLPFWSSQRPRSLRSTVMSSPSGILGSRARTAECVTVDDD
jgi:hypothetical protein